MAPRKKFKAKKAKTTKSGGSRRKYTRKNKKQKPGLFGTLFKWFFLLGFWSAMIFLVIIAWYGVELPQIAENASFVRKNSITVKAADGTVIAQYGDLKGSTIDIKDLPPHLPQAVIAIEDRRFYEHFGLDPIGIARALYSNIAAGGQIRQGGSTITQQLAKNLFLSHERTIKRKAQEALLALWLENTLSKDEILSAYLNRVYLGSGTYGVDAAAQTYFGKSARDVNLLEAATLAGLLKAPSRFSPRNNLTLSQKRARTVLQAMVDTGTITPQQMRNAGSIQITQSVAKPLSINRARYFADWIVSGIDELIGKVDENLIVETTLNMELQTLAENTLDSIIERHEADNKVTQGAILIMQKDGAVITMVGGRNYGQSQFNRVIQAKRPSGSAFKPIVFLTALENGYKPENLILDAPFEEEDHEYRPQNFKDEYFEEVTLTEALTYSLNTASVRLMKDVGVRKTLKTSRKLGIYSPLEANLSTALGSNAVSLAELTTAYTAIANQGLAAFPYGVTSITNTAGELYYTKSRSIPSRRVADRNAMKDLSGMLANVVENGTGRAASISNTVAAGKTGTSQESRDALFVGFTPDLVGGVWLGNDDNTPMQGVTGGTLPAIIWADVMKASKNLHKQDKSLRLETNALKSLLDSLLSGDAESSQTYQFNN